jgi:uncharacterized membrane protein
MSSIDASLRSKTSASQSQRLADFFKRKWFWVFATIYGLFVVIPFLAPFFMRLGWGIPAKAVYFVYSFLCHQLPERSLFLFGDQTMYSLNEIQLVWHNSSDPLVLRQFIGNPTMGWKVAWSDRMISMYGGILFFALLWWPVRHTIQPLPWWGFLLLMLPMAVDGTTHFISDLWGIEQGFRQTNLWLAEMTNHAFLDSFYIGNALGSFNSWMRWISGILFGLGIVWLGFPIINKAIQ